MLGGAAAEQQCDPQPLDHIVISQIGSLWRDFAETDAIGQPARGSQVQPQSMRQAAGAPPI